MLSNHLILCHPLLLLPSILPSIRVFSNFRHKQQRSPTWQPPLTLLIKIESAKVGKVMDTVGFCGSAVCMSLPDPSAYFEEGCLLRGGSFSLCQKDTMALMKAFQLAKDG